MLAVISISPGAGPDANEQGRVTAPSSEVDCCDTNALKFVFLTNNALVSLDARHAAGDGPELPS
jgi:hypothetical protein